MRYRMSDDEDATFGGGILREGRDDGGKNSQETPEMLEFLNRRRAINRRAAQKSRRRQKEHASRVKKLYYDAQSVNTKLTYEKRKLERHRELLLAQWRGHQEGCPRRQWDSAPPSLQSVLVQSPDVVDRDSSMSLSFAADDYANPAAAAFASFPGAARLSRSFSCPPPQTASTAQSSNNNSTSDEDDSMIQSLLNEEEMYFGSSTAEFMCLNLVDDTAEAAMRASGIGPAVGTASTSGGMAGGGVHRQLLDTICESADSSLKQSSMDSMDSSHQQQDAVETQSAVGFLQQQQQQLNSVITYATHQKQQSGNGSELRIKLLPTQTTTRDANLRLPPAIIDTSRETTTDVAAAAGGGGALGVFHSIFDAGYLPQSVVDESDQDYSLCSASSAADENSTTLSTEALLDIGGGSGGGDCVMGDAVSSAGGDSNITSMQGRVERRTAAAVAAGSAAHADVGKASCGPESPCDSNIPIHVQEFRFSK